MSKAHRPPVPPANRSPQGEGKGAEPRPGDMQAEQAEANQAGRDRNLAAQGRQGNVKQNTTHQGHQQDR